MIRFALVLWCGTALAAPNLVSNPTLETRDDVTLVGAAEHGTVGDPNRDNASRGVGLISSKPSGEVSTEVRGIDATKQRWYRFSFRGLPQPNFNTRGDGLYMQVAFFGKDGESYDHKRRSLTDAVLEARKTIDANGRQKRDGAAVWTTYTLDFLVPFPQVETLKLSVGFENGSGGPRDNAFLVDDLSLVAIDDPGLSTAKARPAATRPTNLIPLGGRWFYDAKAGETTAPNRFDSTNADRLLYRDAVYSAPFAGNTTATLRPGMMDASGSVLTEPKAIENLWLSFERGAIVFHTKDVPNHPVGRFPEPGFGNRSYVQEQNETYRIPLEPKLKAKPLVTTKNNANNALNMGPIGVAINGVVFFNPFDMGNVDATDLMDRCCGHPNPDNQYHYHKYPVCVNTPWEDRGDGHSPLIGFALDGLPVYGPFESENVMAKDVRGATALNGCNAHYDDARGWHYHVTPGRFPYILGGYLGEVDASSLQRPPGGPNGNGPPPGNGPRGGRRPGPPPR
jgi:hypothetical protein